MNEFDFIDRIADMCRRSSPDVIKGIGDDCAVIRIEDRDLLVTTDAYVAGVHFLLSRSAGRIIGKKLFHSTASDIAAMGGTPRFLVSCVCIPRGFNAEQCIDIYEGILSECAKHGAAVIGGDTVSSEHDLAFALTMYGETARGTAIMRGGARSGDAIYITGTMGDAALGLACLDKGISNEESSYFTGRYSAPTARLEIGLWLRNSRIVTSMIDVSDGLLSDVGHLAESSNTGYEISAGDVPVHEGFKSLCDAAGADPNQLMLGGGDDYELAFTVDGNRISEFERLLNQADDRPDQRITRIGRMTEDKSMRTVVLPDGSLLTGLKAGYVHLNTI